MEEKTEEQKRIDEAMNESTESKKEKENAVEENPIMKAESILQQLTKGMAELRAENERFEKNLKELKESTVEEMLGGRSYASKKMTEEEKEIEEAKKLLGDSGLNPFE